MKTILNHKIVLLLALILCISACSAIKVKSKEQSYTARTSSVQADEGHPSYLLNFTTPFALSQNNKILFDHITRGVNKHQRMSVGQSGVLELIKYDLKVDVSTDYGALEKKVKVKVRCDLMLNKNRLEEFIIEEYIVVETSGDFGQPVNKVESEAVKELFQRDNSDFGTYFADKIIEKLDVYAREIEESR